MWALPSLALAVAQMRPVLSRPGRAVLASLDGTDAIMQSGILAWSARFWLHPLAWVNLPIFYPARDAIAGMDSLLGQALMVWPVQLAGNPTPALLSNLACLGTLLLVAIAGALLWRAGGDDPSDAGGAAAAGLAALLLLGSPFTGWQLGLLNQISPPWAVLALVAAWSGWRRFAAGDPSAAARRWWAAAICLVLQAAWGWYGFADAVFALAVAAAAGAVAAARRRRLRELLGRVAAPALVAALAVGALATPYLALHAREPGYERSAAEVRHYSADLADLAHAGPHRATWSDWLGRGEVGADRAARNTEPVLFPGWLPLLLAIAGVLGRRRLSPTQRRFGLLLAGIGAAGLVMACGDSVGLPFTGARLPLPFGWLHDHLTPFRAFRAPVRFAFLATLAVTWWAAAGAWTLAGLAGRRRGRVFAGLALAVWFESVPMGLRAMPIPVDGRAGADPVGAALPSGAVLTLPAPATERDEGPIEALWLHRALATGHPVTGGVSGWVPPETRALRSRLAACEAGEADPQRLLADLAGEGVVAAEIAVADGSPASVAYWESAFDSLGWRPRSSVPGYRLYLPPD